MKLFFKGLLFCFLVITIGCADKHKPAKRPITISSKVPYRKKISDINQLPFYIKQYLDSLAGGKFLIANPGQPYAKGCTVMPDQPRCQLIEASIGNNTFTMRYWQGGIALHESLLTMEVHNDQVISWSQVY